MTGIPFMKFMNAELIALNKLSIGSIMIFAAPAKSPDSIFFPASNNLPTITSGNFNISNNVSSKENFFIVAAILSKPNISITLAGEDAFKFQFEGSARKQAQFQINALENEMKRNKELKKQNELRVAELKQSEKELLAKKNNDPFSIEGVPNQTASGNGAAGDVATMSNQPAGPPMAVDASTFNGGDSTTVTTTTNQSISGTRVHPLYSNYSYG